uniref:LRP chaperone MESD n=1 Tax=Steinernema glaseri TaxID=37863 RepID=A0A1I7ZWW0_9BILA
MNWKSIVVFSLLLAAFTLAAEKKKKKDLRDYTDADLERLYEEWEENDEDELPDDEKPEHLRPKPQLSLEELQQQAKSPEDMMRLSKKGQSVMMFVSVSNPSGAKVDKDFSDKITGIWHSNLYNNHIDVQVYNVDVDRALFLFKDGMQAWEAKDFLLKQKECREVTLEGQNYPGAGASAKAKQEL